MQMCVCVWCKHIKDLTCSLRTAHEESGLWEELLSCFLPTLCLHWPINKYPTSHQIVKPVIFLQWWCCSFIGVVWKWICKKEKKENCSLGCDGIEWTVKKMDKWKSTNYTFKTRVTCTKWMYHVTCDTWNGFRSFCVGDHFISTLDAIISDVHLHQTNNIWLGRHWITAILSNHPVTQLRVALWNTTVENDLMCMTPLRVSPD